MKNLLGNLTRNAQWRMTAALVFTTVVGSTAAWSEALSENSQEGGGAAVAASKHKLVWLHDMKSGLESARKSNKFVLVDLFTDWCGWCKKLDKDTYTDPSVLELINSQFVCVKLDAEDGGDGEAFAKQHKVRGFPCIMVLESSGKVRGISYGYRNPPDFIELMKGIIEQAPAANN